MLIYFTSTPSLYFATPPYQPKSIPNPETHPKSSLNLCAAARKIREMSLKVQGIQVDSLGILGVINLLFSMFKFNFVSFAVNMS